MKKIIFLAFLLSITFTSFSQKLNKIGKIGINEIPTIPDYRVDKNNGEYKVHTDSLVFDGNSYYKLPDGFITSLQIADSKKDYIKHYNSKGKLIVSILSNQIINLKISEKGNKLAFFNSEKIIQVNLNNYKLDTLSGSFVFSYVGDEKLIYYNSDDKTINFKGSQISINEFPNQIIEFNSNIIIITEQFIYKLEGNSLVTKYEFKGKFFDARIINNEFYFVDVVEKRKSESFSLYKTSDFSRIMLIDRNDDLNR